MDWKNVYYDPQTSQVMLISDDLYTSYYLVWDISESRHYEMKYIINEHLGKHTTYVNFNEYGNSKKKNNDKVYDFEN